VEAGDIIYTSFIQRNIKAFNTFWIFGTRWDGGNNDSYILFSADPPLADGGWPKNGQNMSNTGQSPYPTPAGVTGPAVRITYTPKWVSPLNPGTSLAAQAGRTVLTEDRVIVAAADKTLQCFNRSDGAFLWSAPLGTHGWQWMQSSTPLVSAAGNIYVGGSNMLYAFNMAGSQLWMQTVATGVDSWVGGSPAISPDGGTVYCAGCCDNDGSKLIAADALTGATNWVYTLKGSSWAAPAVDEQGTIYIGGGVSWSPDPSTEYLLQAINPDGTLKWAASNTPVYVMMQNVQLSPDGSMVVFNDFNDTGNNRRRVTALDAATGTLVWEKEVNNGGEFFPSIGIDDNGDVYCNGEGGFRKLDGSNGDFIWQNTSISRGFTPAISSDGVMWTKPDNEENLIGLDTVSGARIAQIPLGSESLGWTTPAIGDDGLIYISTRSNLYCLEQTSEIAMIDWCNLQWPYQLIDVLALAPSDKVYGQVYIEGATPQPGPTPGLQAWLGYGATNEAPDGVSWNWIEADINPGYTGNNDEYWTNFLFSLSETGVYHYCYRYEYAGQEYVYGQKDGPHSLATYDPAESGLMTVIVPEPCTGIIIGLLILAARRRMK
jgi:outer membrane protein assembly factor BamB